MGRLSMEYNYDTVYMNASVSLKMRHSGKVRMLWHTKGAETNNDKKNWYSIE